MGQPCRPAATSSAGAPVLGVAVALLAGAATLTSPTSTRDSIVHATAAAPARAALQPHRPSTSALDDAAAALHAGEPVLRAVAVHNHQASNVPGHPAGHEEDVHPAPELVNAAPLLFRHRTRPAHSGSASTLHQKKKTKTTRSRFRRPFSKKKDIWTPTWCTSSSSPIESVPANGLELRVSTASP